MEEAIALGADAVSIHINLGLAERVEDAGDRRERRPGLQPLGHAAPHHVYPRGKGIDSFSPQSVGHAVRVAEELGADMIKTNYPGDPEAFRKIVKACSVPVFIAGGEKCGDLESLQIIRDSVGVGGAGVCVGRNAFQREGHHGLCQGAHAGRARERGPGEGAGEEMRWNECKTE